jgi:Ca2+-binding EF-hand superfamily protein
MVLKNGVWCMYAGDLNEDGIVDVSDWSIFLPDMMQQFFDVYIKTDINKDGSVDTDDFSLLMINFNKSPRSPLYYFNH